MLFQILSRKLPFKGKGLSDTLEKIKSGKYHFKDKIWNKISVEAKNLVSNLLELNPKHRLSASQALQHPWFKRTDPTLKIQVDPKILESLQEDKNINTFQQEAMRVIVKHLKDQDIKELIQAFTQMDRDNTGFLTFHQIREALFVSGYPVPSEKIQKIIESVDQNKNGKINYSEFLTYTLSSKFRLNQEVLWEAFKHFDLDNSGFITAENLRLALERSGKLMKMRDVVEIINEVDIENQEKISFEQFKKILQGPVKNQETNEQQMQ